LLVQDPRAFRPLEAELHVLGGEGVAVVELEPLTQLEVVDALVGADRPRLREARREVIARHRLHERVVHRVQHPERREDADHLRGIEPRRRQRDVERVPDLTLGLRLRRRGAGRGEDRDDDQPHHESLPGPRPYAKAGMTSRAKGSMERSTRACSRSPNQNEQLKCVMPTAFWMRLIWRTQVSGVPMTRYSSSRSSTLGP